MHTVKLGTVMSEYGLEQMIHGPTRVTQTSETLTDLLVCTNPSMIVHSECKELGLSDHNMISMWSPECTEVRVEKQKQCVREVRSLHCCDTGNWLQI